VKIFYCDHFVLPLPDGHRFPMEKYAELRRRVALDPATPAGALTVPAAATDAELRRVHTPDWVARVADGSLSREEIRKIGFPWSPGLVERSRRSVGGTIGAARAATSGDGVSVNLAGGTHHAFSDRGEGFCVFNDVAVAIRALQAEGRIHTALVADLDVHQGNGTAAIFRDDPEVFTLSVHGAGNYPFRKEASDLDVELPDGTGDEAYLGAAGDALRTAMERSRPDLLFFLAGADPHEHDRLGRLALTFEGLKARDELVLGTAARAGTPVAVVMSGGYGTRLGDTVTVHHNTVRAAMSMARDGAPQGPPAPGAHRGEARAEPEP
jgi:acetoin utilization deacetylase AcuC-like enzyme